MKVYAISDLHLSFEVAKPMDVFGGNWENYEEKVNDNWQRMVKDEDLVLIAGDISWAMNLSETTKDFDFLANLKGNKVIIRGNHDYWWTTISAVRGVLPKNVFAIQNDCLRFGKYLICGTRGWVVPERGRSLSAQDKKIYDRELIRLELTLKKMEALREPKDKIICMLHYPPFNSQMDENEFTKMLEQYKVDKVVYGHLHGKTKCQNTETKLNGIKYYITSCDKLNNTPIKVF